VHIACTKALVPCKSTVCYALSGVLGDIVTQVFGSSGDDDGENKQCSHIPSTMSLTFVCLPELWRNIKISRTVSVFIPSSDRNECQTSHGDV